MSSHAGMPGPGGSLGQCCYCGRDFMVEILLGKTVKPVQVKGCEQTLYVHHGCAKKLEACKEYPQLPDESPLKQAWLEQAFVKCAGCGERFDALPNKNICPDCEAESARAETLRDTENQNL